VEVGEYVARLISKVHGHSSTHELLFLFFSSFFFLSSFGSKVAAAGRTGMRSQSEHGGHHGEQQREQT
jgi:hypothetical protein